MGNTNYPMSFQVYQQIIIIDQLSTLPIVLGFALMIKLVKRWWLKLKETEQLSKEKTKAELQLLKAGIRLAEVLDAIFKK